MKKNLFYLILTFFPAVVFSQNIEIAGKVVDQFTQDGIGGATVIVFPSGAKTETRPNGNFFIEAEQSEGMLFRF